MRNDDMQAIRNLAHLGYNPHLDLHTHRDHMMYRWYMYSRDRSRRT
jgi:hypothetical protein